MQRFDRSQVFCFGSVFCADGTFLVEFAQIIEIINTVACIIRPCRFVGRRSPDGRDAQFLQMLGILLQAIP